MMLRFAPALTIGLFMAPLAAGLVGTILPALGYLPVLGRSQAGLAPFQALFSWPGLPDAVIGSLMVGFGATALSLLLAFGFCAVALTRPAYARFETALAPLLATPHVALAIGFAFLIAPSGLLLRLVSPWLTGFDRPPMIVTLRDPLGLSLIAGLVLKETAFLVLMMLAAMAQARIRPLVAAACSLGYSPLTAFAKIGVPLVYPLLRLPVYAVLAFSVANVEVALILGPDNPPLLAVQALRWFTSPDLSDYFTGAAAAVLLFALVCACILAWHLGERVIALTFRRWLSGGGRGGLMAPLLAFSARAAVATGVLSLAAIAVMALWSLAASWRYPDAWPASLTLAFWARHLDRAAELAATSAIVAGAATLIALALTLACLENEQRRRLRPGAGSLWLIYLPLLVPQIAFVFGAQIAFIGLGLDATLAAVIWMHLLFVLPYVFLTLAEPWRSLDPRHARIAAALGSGPARVFFRVKLPMLLRPIMLSAAIGFSVSIALYLPTLFAGAGRIATLTTEAVALSSGADRRVIGVYAFLQAALPLLVYALAIGSPKLLYRNRGGMR